MKTTKSASKTVQVIARYFIKRNSAVVYLVKSSNATDTYTTTLVHGKATGCSCPATKLCYHMVQLEAIEIARAEALAAASDKSYNEVLDVQYASDPRESLKAREAAETARCYRDIAWYSEF